MHSSDKEKTMNKTIKKRILSTTGFVALFLAVLTILTLVFLPKWQDREARYLRGFSYEEDNSIDVLMLGSCNMYTSYSPVIAYEEYGLLSYGYTCADQEYCTAYHYLKDALKTQDNIQLVVLETLFLTCNPTDHREYYNRLAVDYMPASFNKLELIFELGAAESEWMQSLDSSNPGKALTYAGYILPLLRYHGRDDVTIEDDVLYWLDHSNYSIYKGSVPLYTYLENETLAFDYVKNGTEIRETSREYFEKIKALCKENDIELLLVTSPNHYRWNEEGLAVIEAFAEAQNVSYVDFHNYDDFTISDYSNTTGRLNVHGMKRFTEHMVEYIEANYDIQRSTLSEENTAKWDEAVEALHAEANKKGMTIDENQIFRIQNEETGIFIEWNSCADCNTYNVFRCDGKAGTYSLVATVTGDNWLDETVMPGCGYTYYIEPTAGSHIGEASETSYYIFVDPITDLTAENKDGSVYMNWTAAESSQSYNFQRKTWNSISYSYWDSYESESTHYNNYSCTSGTLYDYRIRTVIEEDGVKYYSAGVVTRAIPLTTPTITSVSSKNGTATINWKNVENGSSYEIYRRTEDESDFTLYDTVKSSASSYTDKDVEIGMQYFYKIVQTKTKLGIASISYDSNTVGIKVVE